MAMMQPRDGTNSSVVSEDEPEPEMPAPAAAIEEDEEEPADDSEGGVTIRTVGADGEAHDDFRQRHIDRQQQHQAKLLLRSATPPRLKETWLCKHLALVLKFN